MLRPVVEVVLLVWAGGGLASVAIAEGRLYMRTAARLFCIDK